MAEELQNSFYKSLPPIHLEFLKSRYNNQEYVDKVHWKNLNGQKFGRNLTTP